MLPKTSAPNGPRQVPPAKNALTFPYVPHRVGHSISLDPFDEGAQTPVELGDAALHFEAQRGLVVPARGSLLQRHVSDQVTGVIRLPQHRELKKLL